MKKPIPLPVKAVNVSQTQPGDWSAEVTFGIPDDGAHDDPTITIRSGEGLGCIPPKAGDVLMVRPPEILGRFTATVQGIRRRETQPKPTNE